jgi:hypothetical protein
VVTPEVSAAHLLHYRGQDGYAAGHDSLIDLATANALTLQQAQHGDNYLVRQALAVGCQPPGGEELLPSNTPKVIFVLPTSIARSIAAPL